MGEGTRRKGAGREEEIAQPLPARTAANLPQQSHVLGLLKGQGFAETQPTVHVCQSALDCSASSPIVGSLMSFATQLKLILARSSNGCGELDSYGRLSIRANHTSLS